MTAIRVIAVGKLKEAFFKDAADEYTKRLKRYSRFEVVEVPDEKEPENAGSALIQSLIQREGQALLQKIKPEEYVIALCIKGEQMDSEALSEKIRRLSVASRQLVFVIGGSQGLSEEVLKRADEQLSMSKMTFPHQLARVMLLEQLYRAHKILAHERYHK